MRRVWQVKERLDQTRGVRKDLADRIAWNAIRAGAGIGVALPILCAIYNNRPAVLDGVPAAVVLGGMAGGALGGGVALCLVHPIPSGLFVTGCLAAGIAGRLSRRLSR